MLSRVLRPKSDGCRIRAFVPAGRFSPLSAAELDDTARRHCCPRTDVALAPRRRRSQRQQCQRQQICRDRNRDVFRFRFRSHFRNPADMCLFHQHIHMCTFLGIACMMTFIVFFCFFFDLAFALFLRVKKREKKEISFSF